ncbi:WD repeat and FYVE domain-containing protein 1 [Galemys pyrenaicus]|uniref:WD repeat and FYVE domain-containing protein 1 n=1 Tax=Galemys pyrenaicus TaxID=202257 RepID=A0A8J6B8M0_GALPY|nr:WD repeat and FYVE domain-containing protein 1 [Galemys pyrenaicus]
MASPCSAMTYHHDSRRIFVGQDNGAVMEFHVSEDFNKMNFIKTYPEGTDCPFLSPAHQNRVSAIIFSLATEWMVSTGHDKHLSWMCTRSGSLLGRHVFSAWASCLQYDFDTQYAFVGDYSGQITLLKLEQNTCSVITTLKGHEGSVACLWWDPMQRLLFSGASDNSIIMWDIGGRKGRMLLLQGHHDRVQSLCYLQLTRQLVSCSSDGGIAVWNMDVSREEAPQWLESDSCQKCEQPFFWNIKQMWDTKTLGLRQHHCRKCGQAVCGKCSSKRSSYPVMGFEFQVRVCDSCYDSIKDEDRTSLATFHEGKHNISHMAMDVARGLMVTCGTDRVVKGLGGFCGSRTAQPAEPWLAWAARMAGAASEVSCPGRGPPTTCARLNGARPRVLLPPAGWAAAGPSVIHSLADVPSCRAEGFRAGGNDYRLATPEPLAASCFAPLLRHDDVTFRCGDAPEEPCWFQRTALPACSGGPRRLCSAGAGLGHDAGGGLQPGCGVLSALTGSRAARSLPAAAFATQPHPVAPLTVCAWTVATKKQINIFKKKKM